jgi:hypothetical protein
MDGTSLMRFDGPPLEPAGDLGRRLGDPHRAPQQVEARDPTSGPAIYV